MKRSYRFGVALGALAATMVALAACSDVSGSTNGAAQTPTALTVVSGTSQSAPTGITLSSPFVVLVTDQNGFAMYSATVTWAVASGGGTLSSTTSTTDVTGKASTTYTAGTTAGTSTITASVGALSTSFAATAVARTPSILRIVGGDAQTGTVGTPLSLPLSVLLLDQTSTAFPGTTVTWEITSGGGSLSAATSTTDANGGATVRYTAGAAAGTATIRVTVSGLTPVAFTEVIAASP